MRMPCLVLLVACAASFAAGCSSGPSEPPADAGAADAHEGLDGAGDAAASCNDLVNAAPAITIQQVAGDPPAPQGGSIADGTYWLTGATIYTGAGDPSGPTGSGQTTIRIAGTTMDVAASGTPPTRTLTLTVSGTSITATDTCPDTDTSQATYTATATTLVFVLPGGDDDAGTRTVVETYTKQ